MKTKIGSKTRKDSKGRIIRATPRAVRTARLLSENKGLSVGAAMVQAGYSAITAANPQQLTRSKQWADLLEEFLPESDVLATHKGLLRASSLDHQTFAAASADLTDEHIIEMFAELNCKVRRIVHRDTGARDVYFWAADNRARKDALDMAYKLRGTYAAEKHLHVGFSLLDLGKGRDGIQAPSIDAPPLMGEIE